MIEAFAFQPFGQRQGRDTVIGLRFAYDADLVEELKAALRQARSSFGGPPVGGWLAEHRAWFVERRAWDFVRRRLIGAGYEFVEEPGPEREPEFRQAQRPRPPIDLPAVVRQWYRELTLRWHPDRGGSKEGMQAINDAHDRLKQLVGVE